MFDSEKSSNDSKLKKSDDVADLIDISQHVNESVDSPRQSRLQKPRPRALASTSKGTLRDVTPPPQPRIISDPHFVNSDKLAKNKNGLMMRTVNLFVFVVWEKQRIGHENGEIMIL